MQINCVSLISIAFIEPELLQVEKFTTQDLLNVQCPILHENTQKRWSSRTFLKKILWSAGTFWGCPVVKGLEYDSIYFDSKLINFLVTLL